MENFFQWPTINTINIIVDIIVDIIQFNNYQYLLLLLLR